MDLFIGRRLKIHQANGIPEKTGDAIGATGGVRCRFADNDVDLFVREQGLKLIEKALVQRIGLKMKRGHAGITAGRR